MTRIPQKRQFMFCCEGSTEEMLVSFLENQYKTSDNIFKIKNYVGVRDITHFMSSYDKHLDELRRIHSESDITKITFIFVIDNDIPETADIVQLIESNGHSVQLLDPNSEGVLLSQRNVTVSVNDRTKAFRDDCKDIFKQNFGCAPHRLKNGDLIGLFPDITTVERLFPNIIGPLIDRI